MGKCYSMCRNISCLQVVQLFVHVPVVKFFTFTLRVAFFVAPHFEETLFLDMEFPAAEIHGINSSTTLKLLILRFFSLLLEKSLNKS